MATRAVAWMRRLVVVVTRQILWARHVPRPIGLPPAALAIIVAAAGPPFLLGSWVEPDFPVRDQLKVFVAAVAEDARADSAVCANHA